LKKGLAKTTTKVESSNPVFPFVQQEVNPKTKKKKMTMKRKKKKMMMMQKKMTMMKKTHEKLEKAKEELG
jgi:hypothetical protein